MVSYIYFFFHKSSVLYAQIIQLNLSKIINYSNANFIINYIVSFIKLNILYLGNTYITNIPFFDFKKEYVLEKLIENIQYKWSVIVIPDFLINNLKNIKRNDFIKIEIEEEMILNLRSNWSNFQNYITCLKTKYQKKINTILKKSDDIKIRKLSVEDFEYYNDDLQILFDNVIAKTKFSGSKFNTQTFSSLISHNYVDVYGYFLENKIIAFSSELTDNKNLYTYYVGFNTELNKKHALYGRILIESIKNGIKSKKEKIVFGRTASEFKSNFGANPMKSYVYVQFQNIFLHYFFNYFFKRISIKPWIQRHPFK